MKNIKLFVKRDDRRVNLILKLKSFYPYELENETINMLNYLLGKSGFNKHIIKCY